MFILSWYLGRVNNTAPAQSHLFCSISDVISDVQVRNESLSLPGDSVYITSQLWYREYSLRYYQAVF